MPEFDKVSFPIAVGKLFALNNYKVQQSFELHGAEIDILATPTGDPFGRPVYIEATVEYVDNDKYGKDVGKFALVREKDPEAKRLIVSLVGFSNPVRERANESRIETLTYDELFRRFERFEPYVTLYTGATEIACTLQALNTIYEEPLFADAQGSEPATPFLTTWRDSKDSATSWLVVLGEYGTGKTALTRILQYRWLQDYHRDPERPLPIRIELRNFTRQFDVQSLLHYFLDTSGLGHIPVEFVFSLLRSGRIVLLLDGYDEMAQYLHARERRTCLEALAQLATGGARGLLTSRPNYFTEAEELQVFDVLYSSIDHGKYILGKDAKALFERERAVDDLLTRFLDRYERKLKDLTIEQTENLVTRALKDDPKGRETVLSVLRRVSRTTGRGDAISLSGKPVIVTYLLDVVEGLKEAPEATQEIDISEAGVFKLIVDQLMLRDLERAAEVSPDKRRAFLRELAIFLSTRDHSTANEDNFRDIIASCFKRELIRLTPDSRHAQLDRFFADLRSSATLTSDVDNGLTAWRFSHNSLREYLLFEHFLVNLESGEIAPQDVPISDPMRLFASSLGQSQLQSLLARLSTIWKGRNGEFARGRVLSLFWEAFLGLFPQASDLHAECLQHITGNPISLNWVALSGISLSSMDHPAALSNANFSNSTLSGVSFLGADLRGADFSSTVLEVVSFAGATIAGSSFAFSILIDVDFSGTTVEGASFERCSPDSLSILVADPNQQVDAKRRLDGIDALAFLAFHGARTGHIPSKKLWRHHEDFDIIEKIVDKLAEQPIRQRRGLAQRGAATKNVRLAREFVGQLETLDLVRVPGGRSEQVEVTERGRQVFLEFQATDEVPEILLAFIKKKLPIGSRT